MADLRELAQVRLDDARALLDAGRTSGAYYLAGYAVECAVKAVITSAFRQYEMPPKKLVADSHVHDLTTLVHLAGLDKALGAESRENVQFAAYWDLVKDWNEVSRYEVWTHDQADELVRAVGDPEHGVLRWLIALW